MPVVDAEYMNEQACRCGRPRDRKHCPSCGSMQCYALSSRKTIRADGQEYTTYRCRNCGTYFDEKQWREECNAPVVFTKQLRDSKSLQKQQAILDDPQQVALINKLRESRGMTPMQVGERARRLCFDCFAELDQDGKCPNRKCVSNQKQKGA